MIVAVYVLLCLIWSSTWLGIKYVINDVPPVTGAAARFWLTVLIFLVFHLFRGIQFPKSWRTRLEIVALGFPGIGICYTAIYWAELHISSGMTAVLFATFPFVVAAFSARLVEGEGWSMPKLIGLICGTAGVIVVFMHQLEVASIRGAVAVIAVLIGAFVAGVSTVLIKRSYTQYDTVALTALQMVGGALALSFAAITLESPLTVQWTVSSVVATLYLALFGTAVAFFGYFWLLRRIEGTTVATITFVTPVLALFWGWLFLHETITWWLLIGVALVLAGVASVARFGDKGKRPSGASLEMGCPHLGKK